MAIWRRLDMEPYFFGPQTNGIEVVESELPVDEFERLFCDVARDNTDDD